MKKENCKVGDKVVPFQKTRGWIFEQSEVVKNMQEKGYLYISSIEQNSVTLNCDENALDGERFAYEDFEPYIEPKQEPVDNSPNFFNPNVSGTCDCPTLREKECRFFVIDEIVSTACKNRKNEEGYFDSHCHSPEAHADYYSRNPKKEELNEPENEIDKLKDEKHELRLQLEKQIALNVGKDDEINKLRSTNGSLLAVIKKKNMIIANCSKVADKDAKEFSELKNKNERLEDRIFNLSLEVVAKEEEINQLETVINYFLRKSNEKVRK